MCRTVLDPSRSIVLNLTESRRARLHIRNYRNAYVQDHLGDGPGDSPECHTIVVRGSPQIGNETTEAVFSPNPIWYRCHGESPNV